MALLQRARTLAELVKFEHTLLNLPFAYLGAFVAADGWPSWPQLLWVTLAMAGARTAAMAMNRLFDAEIDRRTPRTAARHIPAGLVGRGEVWGYILLSLAALLVATLNLHPLALKLFPLAVLTFTIYPFTKRFTWLCHLWLGLSVSWGALGAHVAVAGTVSWQVLPLVAIITLWNAGFDVLYATQDMGADRVNRVHSIPAAFGLGRALVVARGLHLGVVGLALLFGVTADLLPLSHPLAWPLSGWVYLAGWLTLAALLHYEHSILSPQDMSRLDIAFFNLNGYISVAYALFTATAVVLR